MSKKASTAFSLIDRRNTQRQINGAKILLELENSK